MTKARILNVLLVATSLIGYLEWGQNQHTFLWQAEKEIITKLLSDPSSVVHPFIVLPFLGQLILILTLFQSKPKFWLTMFGASCIAILLVFMLFIGLISLNWKILFSVIPFFTVYILVIRNFRQKRKENSEHSISQVK